MLLVVVVAATLLLSVGEMDVAPGVVAARCRRRMVAGDDAVSLCVTFALVATAVVAAVASSSTAARSLWAAEFAKLVTCVAAMAALASSSDKACSVDGKERTGGVDVVASPRLSSSPACSCGLVVLAVVSADEAAIAALSSKSASSVSSIGPVAGTVSVLS